MEPVLFKALQPGRRGPYSNFIYPRPRTWCPRVEQLVRCSTGYHVCTLVQLPVWLEVEVYPVEVRPDDKPLVEPDKIIYPQVRLLGRLKAWTPRRAGQYGIDAAEHVEHHYTEHCGGAATRHYLAEARNRVKYDQFPPPPPSPVPDDISEEEWQARRLGDYLGFTPEHIQRAVEFHNELVR